MRAHLLISSALLFAAITSYAADEGNSAAPFQKSFSLELGSGIQPLHMTLAPSHKEKLAYADKGIITQEAGNLDCPVISFSEVWRTRPHWELCLTEGISWKIMELRQYDNVFGTDPNGNPRYDISKSPTDIGRGASLPVGSLTFQARFIWSPKWKVTVYSALGAGLTTVTAFYPMPLVTPIALRFKGEHFYVFAEATMGPVATFGHGGIGWKF
ncbi:MAG: hypothetical protein J5695_07320 [Bacteroidales bacterium]|nr:hypothetical protein [Bacteroidales bacterium]